MTKAKFKKVILSLASLNMDEQRETLFKFYENYKGSEEQIDDVCVIGVRV